MKFADLGKGDYAQFIAGWGSAKLLMRLGNKLQKHFELVGGSEKDREEARKWIEKFMPGEVVEGLPRLRPATLT